MTEYENAIEINGITKKYDGFTLDNISFTVPKGSIMGFVGQNGAGKTTTIRSLMNIIRIDSGEIKLLGMDHIKDEYAVKERIAVVFDELRHPQRKIYLRTIYLVHVLLQAASFCCRGSVHYTFRLD